MFDDIFTYSQSISSSCRNSLVSGRKGKRGRRAHTELSYFVSFFPSDNILCSFFFCFVFVPLLKFLVLVTPAHVFVSSQGNFADTPGERLKVTVLPVLLIPSVFGLEVDPHVGIRWEEHYTWTSAAKNVHLNKSVYHWKVKVKNVNLAALVHYFTFC